MVLWCSEEYSTTASYRMQQALEVLESWTKKWSVQVNSTKTTYTVFSLSPKEQKVTMRLGNQTLNAENNPTYLGVTFDKRLTWKQHTQRTESRAKVCLALMKKLASTTWGADASTLKRLYTGRVRPLLEYGMAAWGTTAKTKNMDKISKVQNQAARIITRSMRSTPIQELETITGLQPLLDRCYEKLLTQAAKFKRLSGHLMDERMYQPTRGRLKRENFVHQSKCLEQRHRDILEQNPKKISQCPEIPAWSKERHFLFKSGVPGIGPKDSQNGLLRKLITLEHLQQCYPKETWTYIFTDGSAEDATCNGGAGVYVKYPDGTDDRLSFATGLYSTNYKAEAEALRAAAAHIENSPHLSHRVVFLSDALSALQALQTGKDTDLNNLV